MLDYPDEQVALTGLPGPLRLEDLLFAAQKSNRIVPLQVVRADRVVGADHVRSAALHAHRAFKEGRAQAATLEVEFLRYLAGERQIRKALDKMGLPDPAPAAVAIALGEKRMDGLRHFVHSLGLREDDSLIGADEDRLREFGITAAQVGATTPERRLDLALEAVAAVDLMK
jgi:KEOPS complex subunit Cgi121